jgi:hypothetical protein
VYDMLCTLTFGLAYLTPIIVLGIFGIIAETTGAGAPPRTSWRGVAMLFTAHNYGRMAIIHPVAGSPSIPRRRKGRWRVPRWAGCGGCSSWWSR